MAKPKKGSSKDQKLDFGDITSIMGEGSDFCFVYGDDESDAQMTSNFHFSTGITVLDTIIGEGGFGSGKISEVYGPNKSGKSELAQRTMEQFLLDYPNGIGIYFDEETSLDDKKMLQCPIFKCGRLIVKKSTSMEAAFNSLIKMMNMLIKDERKEPVFIVFDSVAAMGTIEEMEGELGKTIVAAQARVLSTALRRIRGKIRRTNAHIMFVNQVRGKVGGMGFGEKTESACGEALKFYSDYRLKMSNIGAYRFSTGGPPDGYQLQAKTMKNKRVTPMREVKIPLLFSPYGDKKSGMSEMWSLYDALKDNKIIKVKGGNCTIAGGESAFKKSGWPAFMNSGPPCIQQAVLALKEAIMLVKDDMDGGEDSEDDFDLPPPVED